MTLSHWHSYTTWTIFYRPTGKVRIWRNLCFPHPRLSKEAYRIHYYSDLAICSKSSSTSLLTARGLLTCLPHYLEEVILYMVVL